MLLWQFARVDLKVDYGQRVNRYFKTEEAALSGVALEESLIRILDIVVIVDAFRSRFKLLIASECLPT